MGQKDKVKIFKLFSHLEAATFQGFPKKRVGSPRFMELQISNTLQKVHISAMMSAHNNCTNKNGTKHNKYQQHTLHKEWPTDSSSNKVSFVQIFSTFVHQKSEKVHLRPGPSLVYAGIFFY